MRSLAALIAALLGVVALVACEPAPPTFLETFSDPVAFGQRFDRGASYTVSQLDASVGVTEFHGDHNDMCEGPDTGRTVHWTADPTQPEMFWQCSPRGPDSGHLMTGMNTLGYDHLWFTPKRTFTDVSQVCVDVNANRMSGRKWWEIQFVDMADATRYPSTKATGGYDLGYTNPGFRADPGPHTGIFPASGTLAGLINEQGNFHWFQNQNQVTTGGAVGWPGRIGASGLPVITDKAARYTVCVQDPDPNDNKVTVVEQLPPQFGPLQGIQDPTTGKWWRVLDIPGRFPAGEVKVVFHDANYDPPKDEANFNPESVTWHWDNVSITERAKPAS